jgi:hypothetical protein
MIAQSHKPTRFFSEIEIVESLVNTGIPFKKVGQEIEADVLNSGHFSHKISTKKGGLWLSSDGQKGTFSQLLHSLKTTPAKASTAAPTARNIQADLAKIQEDSRKMAREIWSSAWAIKSIHEFYDGADLDKMTARAKGARRRAMEAARDAGIAYLESSKLDTRWLTESGIYRIAACEKQGENRKEYDLGARAILVSPMGNRLDPTGVQRLYLTPEGVKVGRRMRGRKSVTIVEPLQNAVPMFQDDGIKLHDEGLETALSMVQVCGIQGRCYWDAGTLKAAFLHNAELAENASAEQKNALQMQIFLVDRDVSYTGQNACAESIRAMVNAGIAPEKLVYALPPEAVAGGSKGADWRDVFLELGSDGCRQALIDCVIAPVTLPAPVIVAQTITFRKLKQGKLSPFIHNNKGTLEDAAEIVRAGIGCHVNSQSKKNIALAVDCGVGKSHLAAEITNAGTRPTLTVTPTRALAADASYCVAPARSNDEFSSGYCNVYPEIEPFSEKWRSIVVHKCRTCPHGIAAMDYIHSKKDEDYQENRAPGVDMCQYILATDAMRNTLQISATAQKLETDPTLTNYGKARRRVILDDTCNLNEHKMILPHLISQWGQLTRIAIAYDQKAMVDNSEFIARERAERKLLPLLDKLAAFVAGHSGEQVQIDPRKWRTFYQRVHNTAIKYQDGTTAEAVRLDNEGKMVIPLRALRQVAVAIQRGTAWVAAGKLFIATPTEALKQIKKGGVLVADATLSKAVQAIMPDAITARVKTPNLKIIQVFSGQHSKNAVNADADNGFGLALEAQRLMTVVQEKIDSGIAPDKICVLSHMDLIKPLLKDGAPQILGIPPENLGWFGNHSRGHNHWKECAYLVQWGVPRLGGDNAQRQYMADRQGVMEVGGQAWHTWSQDWCQRSKQVPGGTLWSLGEGYADPHVDAWDASWVTGETVQAIGRLRAARRPDEVLTVEIHSDFQFSVDHGFHVDDVQERAWTKSKNDLRIDWLAGVYKTLAGEGVVGQRDFNAVLTELGEHGVNWQLFVKVAELATGVYIDCIGGCSQTGNFHPDDSVDFMPKEAENLAPPAGWQEMMENVPAFDPEEYDFDGEGDGDWDDMAVAAGGGS